MSTVIYDRNACGYQWRSAYLDGLRAAGYRLQRFYGEALDEAVQDGRPRVLVDVQGDDKPTRLTVIALAPTELPAGVVGGDMRGHGWKIVQRWTQDLDPDITPPLLAARVVEEVARMYAGLALDEVGATL